MKMSKHQEFQLRFTRLAGGQRRGSRTHHEKWAIRMAINPQMTAPKAQPSVRIVPLTEAVSESEFVSPMASQSAFGATAVLLARPERKLISVSPGARNR